MAQITINGVLREITGVAGRPDLDVNRVLFYEKDGKEAAMIFKHDVLTYEMDASSGVQDVDYTSATEVSLDTDGLAYQKLPSGYFNEGSIGGIYADDLGGSTFTTNNHTNYTT